MFPVSTFPTEDEQNHVGLTDRGRDWVACGWNTEQAPHGADESHPRLTGSRGMNACLKAAMLKISEGSGHGHGYGDGESEGGGLVCLAMAPPASFPARLCFPPCSPNFQSVAGDVIAVAGGRERARKAEEVFEASLLPFIL